MSVLVIWGGAVVAYVAFYLWYNGLRRPLTAQEIDAYVQRLQESTVETTPELLQTMRTFLESDDGGEYFMVNLVRVSPEMVRGPGDDTVRPARQVLERYTRHFMPALLRRGGHPALVVMRAGGYLEHWGVEADPAWSFAGLIRYRSRRDMMELVLDPRFAQAHLFKKAAIERTFAFPARLALMTFGPRIVVALAIALLAAVFQLVLK